MLIQTFAIRLLTVLVYFLPFTFFMAGCEDDDVVLIHDKKQAYEIAQKKIKSDMEVVDRLIKQEDTSKLVIESDRQYIETILQTNVDETFKVNEQWYEKVLYPMPNYISGFGLLLWAKTNVMGVTIWISAILSLLTFLFWRFIARWMIAVLFVGANFIVVLIYMISCLRNSVSIEYGFWLLFFLLLIQLWVEMRQLKYSIIGRLLAGLSKQ